MFQRYIRKLLNPTKLSHFETIEMMEAESQAVVNTLKDHDFQNAFKKWQKHW
jgi:hypothetical protein